MDAAAEAGIPTCISYVAIKGGQAAGPSADLHPAAARPAGGSSSSGFGPVIMINGTGTGTGTGIGSDSSQAHIRTSIQGERAAGDGAAEAPLLAGHWDAAQEARRRWQTAAAGCTRALILTIIWLHPQSARAAP